MNRVPNWFSERWKSAYNRMANNAIMDARPEELDFDDWIALAQDMAENDNPN